MRRVIERGLVALFYRVWRATVIGALALSATTVAPMVVGAQGATEFRERIVPAIKAGEWTGARLSDGQPDVQGHWSNTIGNHNNFTDPQGGGPDEEQPRQRGARADRAPSRVSDPVSGEVPFQPWARAKAAEFAAHLSNPTRPEYVEPLARCAPAGPTKSLGARVRREQRSARRDRGGAMRRRPCGHIVRCARSVSSCLDPDS